MELPSCWSREGSRRAPGPVVADPSKKFTSGGVLPYRACGLDPGRTKGEGHPRAAAAPAPAASRVQIRCDGQVLELDRLERRPRWRDRRTVGGDLHDHLAGSALQGRVHVHGAHVPNPLPVSLSTAGVRTLVTP